MQPRPSPTALHDERRLGRAFAYLAEYFRLTGDAARAVESGERALALATALGDFALEVMATFFVGTAYRALGDYRRAADCFRRNVASLTGELIHERFGMTGLPAVMSRTWLVSCLADLGAFDEGTARGEEAVRMAEAGRSPLQPDPSLFRSRQSVPPQRGPLQGHPGARTRPWSVSGREHPDLVSHRRRDLRVRIYPGGARGRGPAAAAAGGGAGHSPEALSAAHARWVAYLSEAYLLTGRRDEAMGLARSALAFARDLKARGNEAYALWLLGEIHTHQAPLDVEAAEGAYRQALALAEELGMRPLLAHCHLGLGTLYTKVGRLAPGARRTLHRHRALPGDGDDVLAAPGGGHAGTDGIKRRGIAA